MGGACLGSAGTQCQEEVRTRRLHVQGERPLPVVHHAGSNAKRAQPDEEHGNVCHGPCCCDEHVLGGRAAVAHKGEAAQWPQQDAVYRSPDLQYGR